MDHLKGKSVIITGASKGIGAEAAKLFAAEGAKVMLAARSGDLIDRLATEIEDAGGTAIALETDVSDFESVDELVRRTVKAFGGVDILVNNAGVIKPIARIAESEPEAWAHAADINYKGVYFGIRAVLPLMEKAGAGTIINISSGAATGALEGWSHYCSSKAAALSLTKCTDVEAREKGVRVIGLSPGTVATEMQVQIKASGINPVSQLDPSIHIPAEWVAKCIAWLCGPGGDDYLGTDCSLREPRVREALGLPQA